MVGREIKFNIEKEIFQGEILDKVRVFNTSCNTDHYLVETTKGEIKVVDPFDIKEVVS